MHVGAREGMKRTLAPSFDELRMFIMSLEIKAEQILRHGESDQQRNRGDQSLAGSSHICWASKDRLQARLGYSESANDHEKNEYPL